MRTIAWTGGIAGVLVVSMLSVAAVAAPRTTAGGGIDSLHARNRAASASQAYDEGDFQGAIQMYRAALAGEDDPDWHRGLALSLMNLGRCREALPEFEKDNTAHRGRGMAHCLGTVGRWDKALSELRRYAVAFPHEETVEVLQRDLELGRDGKLAPAAFAARADAEDKARWVGTKLWRFWGARAVEGGHGDLRCWPAQASDRHHTSEWPSMAEGMIKAVTEALDEDPGSPSAAYYLACLTYNRWEPDSDPSGKALGDALAILDRPQVRDKDTPAIVALRAELAKIRDGRASIATAMKAFDKLVAKLAHGKPVGELPAASEVLANPNAYKGQLARVQVRHPGRVTLLVDERHRCQFELADAAGLAGEFQERLGRFIVDGPFTCPWAVDEEHPYNFEMLVRVSGVHEAVTAGQVRVALPRLELLALQFGEIVGRR
jgi:tetratricopeptide (TPR) repeat protein